MIEKCLFLWLLRHKISKFTAAFLKDDCACCVDLIRCVCAIKCPLSLFFWQLRSGNKEFCQLMTFVCVPVQSCMLCTTVYPLFTVSGHDHNMTTSWRVWWTELVTFHFRAHRLSEVNRWVYWPSQLYFTELLLQQVSDVWKGRTLAWKCEQRSRGWSCRRTLILYLLTSTSLIVTLTSDLWAVLWWWSSILLTSSSFFINDAQILLYS